MEKYQPEGGYGSFPEDKLEVTSVVCIDIAMITGKQDLGKEYEQQEVFQLLKDRLVPATVLERS